MSFDTNMQDLHESYDGLMKDAFKLKNFYTFTYDSPQYDGISFAAKFYQRKATSTTQEASGAKCTFNYSDSFVQAQNTIGTDGAIKIASVFNLDKHVKNLTAEFKVNTNYVLDQFEGKTSAIWKKDKYNLKGTLDWRNEKNFKAKGVGILLDEPNRKIGAGLGFKFALASKSFSIYNVTLWYHTANANILLFHKTSKFELEKLGAKVFNKVDDKTSVALGMKHNFLKKSDKLTFGCNYKHSDGCVVKTQLDSKLNLRAAFELAINKSVNLSVISKYELGEKNEDSKEIPIAIRLNFSN